MRRVVVRVRVPARAPLPRNIVIRTTLGRGRRVAQSTRLPGRATRTHSGRARRRVGVGSRGACAERAGERAARPACQAAIGIAARHSARAIWNSGAGC